MRRRAYDGFISGQPIDTHVEKAAYLQPEQKKKKYQKSFHQSQLLPLSFPQVNPRANDLVQIDDGHFEVWRLCPILSLNLGLEQFFALHKSSHTSLQAPSPVIASGAKQSH